MAGILVPPDFPGIHLLAHFLGGAGVVDEVGHEEVTNHITIVLSLALVLEHGVLKWLQNPLLKYVILKQAISS